METILIIISKKYIYIFRAMTHFRPKIGESSQL